MHTHLSPPGSLSLPLSRLEIRRTSSSSRRRGLEICASHVTRVKSPLSVFRRCRGPRDVRETSVGKKEKLDIPFLFLPFRLSFPFIDRS